VVKAPLVTVAVLTYNGDDHLEHVLSQLELQQFEPGFEVLVLDSGSTDRTLEIVASHPSVRLHEIPNSEFGHGRTRNLAASLSSAEIIAYLTQDAIPASERWLAELVDPLLRYPDVVGVTGRQEPRTYCFPLLKYEINAVFDGLGPSFGTALFRWDEARGPIALGDAQAFYSDVNSAARRSVLIGEIPYRDVPYAEDQLFGFDALSAGYAKAYSGRGVVVHSNDLTLAQYSKRMFDETVGLREIGFPVSAVSLGFAVKTTVKGVLRDSLGIVRDPHYSALKKVYWLAANPFFHVAKWRSVRRATRVRLDDAAARSRFSLESSRRPAE
jgi:rhamnosyltransferase